MDWDSYFMEMAYTVSKKSKHPSTKVGAVIVGPDNEIRSTGYNSLVRGLDDENEAYYDKPLDNFYFEHAERNAIYNAARCGTPLKDCKIYCFFKPCADCMKGLISVGITEVIVDSNYESNLPSYSGRWKESIEHGENMAQIVGVKVRLWCDEIKN